MQPPVPTCKSGAVNGPGLGKDLVTRDLVIIMNLLVNTFIDLEVKDLHDAWFARFKNWFIVVSDFNIHIFTNFAKGAKLGIDLDKIRKQDELDLRHKVLLDFIKEYKEYKEYKGKKDNK